MGSSLTGLVGGNGGQGVTTSLCDQLMQKLVPLVEIILSKELEPPLAIAIAAQLTENIPRDLEVFVSHAVFTDLTRRLHPVLVESLSKAIPIVVESDFARNLALMSLRPIVHTLSRSLPHAIIPSLIHTLTHSASQDYICNECYKSGKYCKYCHYSSTQVFYGTYYAGFFSSYYGDYYSDYYFNYFRNMFFPPQLVPIETDDTSDTVMPDAVPI